jgi:hypothetical protein
VAGRFAANWPRTAAAATALLGARFGLIVVLLHVPRAVTDPFALAAWSGVAEQLALARAGVLATSGHGSGLRTRADARAAPLVFVAEVYARGCIGRQ